MKLVILIPLVFICSIAVVAMFFLLVKYWSDKFLNKRERKRGRDPFTPYREDENTGKK